MAAPAGTDLLAVLTDAKAPTGPALSGTPDGIAAGLAAHAAAGADHVIAALEPATPAMSDPTCLPFAFPSVRAKKLTAAFDGGRHYSRPLVTERRLQSRSFRIGQVINNKGCHGGCTRKTGRREARLHGRTGLQTGSSVLRMVSAPLDRP